nr:unnamed protein product [Digitaria exilis]
MCCRKKPVLISFSFFKLLRMLDLEGCWWLTNEDLKEICKMSLLRYLCLRRTNVSQLPKLVGVLKELVTLDVRETSIRELPDTITELANLKHLLGGRLKQLIVDNAPNLDELRFDGGAPNLERLTLAFEREPANGIFGIENLPRLKEVEFFGEVIVDSLAHLQKCSPKTTYFIVSRAKTFTILGIGAEE